MALVPMKQILDEAERGGYGVGAFNANNMEQIQAITRAAREVDSPVIIQASRGALRYTNLIYLKKVMEAAVEDNPGVKIALHLDHGNDLDLVKTAIGLGFTSVMLDGSLEADGKTPRSFESNVDITRRAVEIAHPYGVTVEGELGTLGGVEEHVAVSLRHPDRPGGSGTVRRADRRRRPRRRHRHIAWRVQVQRGSEACPRHRGEDPRAPAGGALGDARVFERAPRARQCRQRVRRRDAERPGRARRSDSGGDQAWRPKDQR